MKFGVFDHLDASGAPLEAGLNYFLLRFAFGDLSFAEAMRSADLFAARVQPALEEVPA